MRNFEKIKNELTPEIMVELLYWADGEWCSAYTDEDGDIVCDKNNCKECIKNWLESEVDEVGEISKGEIPQ